MHWGFVTECNNLKGNNLREELVYKKHRIFVLGLDHMNQLEKISKTNNVLWDSGIMSIRPVIENFIHEGYVDRTFVNLSM